MGEQIGPGRGQLVKDERAAGDLRQDREKAGAGLLKVVAVPGAVVLGADTEVILDGRVFGKPAGADAAAAMLRALSGRSHEVVTAVSLVSAGREAQAVSVSQVRVAPMSEAEIAACLASGECEGKAGAYAIQGRFQLHIEHLSGSYSGVMGLPLFETGRLLKQFGLLQ